MGIIKKKEIKKSENGGPLSYKYRQWCECTRNKLIMIQSILELTKFDQIASYYVLSPWIMTDLDGSRVIINIYSWKYFVFLYVFSPFHIKFKKHNDSLLFYNKNLYYSSIFFFPKLKLVMMKDKIDKNELFFVLKY